jgi:hypothetical protein
MLELVPITLDEANEFVRRLHRHNAAMPGCKFCMAVSDGERVVGVAIAGRPVARMLDDGWTLEINRTCTDGYRNANSMLYGACLRAAWALGYRRVVTYSLPEESGASLRAAGFRCMGHCGGGSWNRKARPRIDTHPLQEKLRWEANPRVSAKEKP